MSGRPNFSMSRTIDSASGSSSSTQYYKRATSNTGQDEDEDKLLSGSTDNGPNKWLVVCILIVVILAITGAVIGTVLTENEHAATTTTIGESTTGGIVATIGEIIAAEPASTPSSAILSIEPLCNVLLGGGECRSILTYVNRRDQVIHAPVGSQNSLSAPTIGESQRQFFEPGTHFGAATFVWDCGSHDSVTWAVGAPNDFVAEATIPSYAVDCPPLPL